MPHDITTVWESLRMQIDAHRTHDAAIRQDGHHSTVPVCLVTGFLGAGKSTILAHALQNPGGRRIRALVNDVGQLPFDPALVEFADSLDVELSNGCGCCATTTDLAESLRTQVERGNCDLLVLEASGAADPRALAQLVHANASLTLDRIVAVVTAEQLLCLNHTEFASAVRRQLDSAQCVIVSGCDRVTEEKAELALEVAATICPGRTLRMSSSENLASEVLFPEFPRGTNPAVDYSPFTHHDLHVATINNPAPVDKSEFMRALANAQNSLVRAKGRLLLDNELVSVQVTTAHIEVCPIADGDTGITLMTTHPEPLQIFRQLFHHE